MEFDLTPDEVRPMASAVAKWLESRGFRVRVETPVRKDAPARTTLTATQGQLAVLVEVQTDLSYLGLVQELARYVRSRRLFVELYVAIKEKPEPNLSSACLKELENDGVGLLLVSEEGSVHESRHARNPAREVTLDAGLPLGSRTKEVELIFRRFNEGQRKAALEEMVELVEGLIDKVACKAARKGYLRKTESDVRTADLSNKINMLASSQLASCGKPPVFSDALKQDLHSFRESRNLLKHPARGRRGAQRRERQFPERMHMGARLTSDLLGIERKIR